MYYNGSNRQDYDNFKLWVMHYGQEIMSNFKRFEKFLFFINICLMIIYKFYLKD